MLQDCTHAFSRNDHSGPMAPGNNCWQMIRNYHPIILMGDLAYVWVHWKKFVATHWLDSIGLLLQPTSCGGGIFSLQHESAF